MQRIVLALQSFFRILWNATYAARVLQLDASTQAPASSEAAARPGRDLRPALQLLSALQREGRLVDFVQQDIVTFSDTDVGAAARVVHDGCRRALRHMLEIVPVHDAVEGHSVTVQAGFDAASLQLSGNVSGSPPFHGTLRHRGWRARGLSLPDIVGDADCSVIAPAEVEL